MQNDATAETTTAIQEVFGPSGTYFLPELTWAGAYAWRQEVNFVITITRNRWRRNTHARDGSRI